MIQINPFYQLFSVIINTNDIKSCKKIYFKQHFILYRDTARLVLNESHIIVNTK